MLNAEQVITLLDRAEQLGKSSLIPKPQKDKLKGLAEELLSEYSSLEELQARYALFIMLGNKL